MSPDQYNECLRQANLAIKRLQSKIGKLEKENSELTNDLIETQNSCREAENKLEDIELFFTDQDACPIIEPLNSHGLDSWFKVFNLQQQAKGVEDALKFAHEGSGSDKVWSIRHYAMKLKMKIKQSRGE